MHDTSFICTCTTFYFYKQQFYFLQLTKYGALQRRQQNQFKFFKVQDITQINTNVWYEKYSFSLNFFP